MTEPEDTGPIHIDVVEEFNKLIGKYTHAEDEYELMIIAIKLRDELIATRKELENERERCAMIAEGLLCSKHVCDHSDVIAKAIRKPQGD